MRCRKCNGIVPSVQSEITKKTQTCFKCRGNKQGHRTRKARTSSKIVQEDIFTS